MSRPSRKLWDTLSADQQFQLYCNVGKQADRYRLEAEAARAQTFAAKSRLADREIESVADVVLKTINSSNATRTIRRQGRGVWRPGNAKPRNGPE